MCTAISVNFKNHYFGRNLDYEHTFGEKIAITPRNYRFAFKNGENITAERAIIGMALPKNDYPLYFDAVNEKGLAVAGLNFPENAFYNEKIEGKINLASFEIIPYLLSKCDTVKEAKELLLNINITNDAFEKELPPTPLHWLIADKNGAITLEQTSSGLKIYENMMGVLTNNPTFDIQIFNLTNFMMLSNDEAENRFSNKINLNPYSRGMGALGLPGDFSSVSRFVKTCFLKLNSVLYGNEIESLHQFFHILYSVYQVNGSVRAGEEFVTTNYTSCCNTDKGIYYYTTYNNLNICAVSMHKENLDGDTLICYDLKKDSEIILQN